MLIAKVEDGHVVHIKDHQEMFPNTSFPDGGPTDAFMTQCSCLVVRATRKHQPATQEVVPCDPYIENSIVYTAHVRDLSEEAILAKFAAAKADKIKIVKQECADIILGKYPAWKQANMLAEMSIINTARPSRPLTVGEEAFMAKFSAAYQWSKDVRAVSDQIEAEIGATTSLEELAAIQWADRWPQ